ncbi:hypothetical protein GOODEAATRI_025842 [Goodea atripinnis]|uniref:Uncharacterized protein n=1 Tax=Goodea atripinnis TaxID=208336 RepID=A0ABV0PH78_9TELE
MILLMSKTDSDSTGKTTPHAETKTAQWKVKERPNILKPENLGMNLLSDPHAAAAGWNIVTNVRSRGGWSECNPCRAASLGLRTDLVSLQTTRVPPPLRAGQPGIMSRCQAHGDRHETTVYTQVTGLQPDSFDVACKIWAQQIINPYWLITGIG